MSNEITYRDRQLIVHTLKYNVQIAKRTVDIYTEIDGNQKPDFDKIAAWIKDIRVWIKQIDTLRAVIRQRKADPNKLVSAYLYDTESFDEWFADREKHFAEVKSKVYKTRMAWVYSSRDTLRYEATLWLDPSAIKLAKFLDFSLE